MLDFQNEDSLMGKKTAPDQSHPRRRCRPRKMGRQDEPRTGGCHVSRREEEEAKREVSDASFYGMCCS